MTRHPVAASLRRLLAAASLGGALVASEAAAQPAGPPAGPPPTTFPDTPLGRLGQRLVAVIDGGDSAAIARFVAERFVTGHAGNDLLGADDAVARARTYVTLHRQSGGLEVTRIRQVGSALRVFTRARNGRRYLGLELEPAGGDTTRLAHVGLYPMDDPGMRMPPAPWATGTLDDSAIAAVIERKVREAAEADRFSGVVLVARGDRVLVHAAHGFADRERGRPNTTRTAFATTSVGKMFTGVAVMQLVERGLLRLDDTLARVLPEYPNREAAARVTVRQLLTHTAGIPEPFLSPRFGSGDDSASHATLLRTFADAPLDVEPGREHRYSNGNYLALAAIVERLSGQSYERYLRERVWGPASLRQVEHPAWSDAPGRGVGYARFTSTDPLGVEARRAADPPARAYRGELRGFGGGAFTAEDLFRFARALRTGRLLRADLADSAMTGQVDIGQGAPVKYGFGFYEQRFGDRRVVGHRGSNPNTGWDADVEMVGDWTVVVLSNYDAPAGIELAMPIVTLLAGSGR